MPTYEYECTKCGHTFELYQSITAKPLSRCPECKGSVRRIIYGGMGVIFKGSGFYSTDNKRGSAIAGGNGSSAKEKDKSAEKSAEKQARSGLRPKASRRRPISRRREARRRPAKDPTTTAAQPAEYGLSCALH